MRARRRENAPPTDDKLICQLAPLDQEIIRLVHWDGLALAEAASLLGQRPSTVRSRYHRARKHLRSRL